MSYIRSNEEYEEHITADAAALPPVPMDTLTCNGTTFKVGQKVIFGRHPYEIAVFKHFPHGWMVGIYDEPPGRHIDFLNPEGLQLAP
jgi:hypothetical protein